MDKRSSLFGLIVVDEEKKKFLRDRYKLSGKYVRVLQILESFWSPFLIQTERRAHRRGRRRFRRFSLRQFLEDVVGKLGQC
jgi:truncated hemoglobin YjbI